ncbi:MAG: site-specific DNA-methyltransferase [Succinivibrio sp.]|nr:site-specific DNA-methyltransferase [Succinivibrio sp.]
MTELKKLDMKSVDVTSENIEKIGALFPNCITESQDENGNLRKAINFEVLQQLLSKDLVEGKERYEFTWPGKKQAILDANVSISKTLRPCVEESKDWENTKNLYIEGDNLEALKLLQKSYFGKVKMIYIDPPYNTGNDFIYEDDFSVSSDEYNDEIGQQDDDGNRLFKKNSDSDGRFHSKWCSMIYSRLLIARNLLSQDGTICISIDDNEFENMKKICNEVFGETNLVSVFVWNCSTGGGLRPKFASKTHEYICVYAKSIEYLPMLYAPLSDEAKKMYTQHDEKGTYRDKDFIFKNSSQNNNQKYLIECPDGEKVLPKEGYIYRFIKESFNKALSDGLVTFKKTTTGPLLTEAGNQAHWNIYIKKYLGDATGAPSTLVPKEMMSIYNVGTQCVQSLFDNKRVFENVKPVDVIAYMANMLSSDEDIILDFFSGSATTAHSIMQLNAEFGRNKKFIMVQLPAKTGEKTEAFKCGFKNICEIGKERIRRAAKKIAEEKPNSKFDSGFRVLKIASSNMKNVYYNPKDLNLDLLATLETNIKEDRTDLDLLFASILDFGLTLDCPIKEEVIDGAKVYIYNDDEEEGPDLIACFADNISEDVITYIAKRHPTKAVFKDSSFENSPSKINLFEIFKMHANISDDKELQELVRVI